MPSTCSSAPKDKYASSTRLDSRLRHVFPNKLRQVAANLVRERQLSIGKRARTPKSPS